MSSEKDDKLMTLGERIRFIRKKLALNQKQLADYVGLKSATAISLYENNKREPEFAVLETLNRLANINLNWLITGRGAAFNKQNESATENDVSPREVGGESLSIPADIQPVHDAFMEVMLSDDRGTKLALSQNVFTFQRTVRNELKVSKLEEDIQEIKRVLGPREADFKIQGTSRVSRQPEEKHRAGGK